MGTSDRETGTTRVVITRGNGSIYLDTTMPTNEARGYALRWRADIRHNAYGDRTGWTVKTEKVR